MTRHSTKRLIQSFWKKLAAKPASDSFLRGCTGVIHVGANSGQERELYSQHNLDVLWIEPIPEIFEVLKTNIAPFPKQRAVCALVTDVNGEEFPFHVSNNAGESSSILDLAAHKELWPDVKYARTIKVTSVTLPALLKLEALDPDLFDILVLDTQGSELLVLKGTESILKHFTHIKTEAADFEAYKDCCQIGDLDAFLTERGFRRTRTEPFAVKEGTGTYYNVLYKRKSS